MTPSNNHKTSNSLLRFLVRTIGDLERRYPRLAKFIKFGTVGASGVIVNNGILWILFMQFGISAMLASIIATECAIITNFIGNSLWTWRHHTEGSWRKKLLTFQAVSLIAGALTVGIFWMFHTYLNIPLLIANTSAILIVFIVNFGLNSKFTWKETAKAELHEHKEIASANTHNVAHMKVR